MCIKLAHLFSLVLLLGLAGNAFSDLTNDPSLVIYYDFEGFGNNLSVFDKSGKGHDATVIGSVSGIAGAGIRDSEACQVTGDGSYLDLDGLNFPTEDIPTTAFTLAYWVKPEDTGGTQTVFSALALPHSWCHGGYVRNNQYHAHLGDIDNKYIINAYEGTVEYGVWHHMALTWELVPGEYGGGAMYIDGELVAEYGNEFVEATPGVLAADNWGGGARMGRDVDDSWQFRGFLDDFCMFKRALSPAEVKELMQGIESPIALGPDPRDGTIIEQTWITLGWMPGDFAVSHDVYFGDAFDAVNNPGAPGATPEFRANQIDTYFIVGFPGFPYPDGLVPGTTYYWRIDEVNEAEPNSPWKGDIWSFSIPPKTAYRPDPPDGAQFVDMNATLSWAPGFGAKLHTVHVGTSFEDVNDAAGGAPQGITTYSPGPLESEKVYYWRVDEFDAVETHKGDIWSFTTPGAVGNPQPANGAADVQMTATLSWTTADNAISHELYFGTDKDAVSNASTTWPEYIGPRKLGSENYEPGRLAWDCAYYWRVDEVYSVETIRGPVWGFATADFILVDDFESYNDIDPPDPNSNRVFDKWIDGFGTTDNGAIVGNDMPPYAEQIIVHGSAQSMPYMYDNNLKISEATLTLAYPRDWTEEGVTKLSLWFRGASANSAEQMFVALNGTAVVYHDDTAATQITGWNEWVIDLSAFAGLGVDLTNVDTITIGIGTKTPGAPGPGGTGMMYFDDIRLVR
ncbi:MAG: LamG domain-containing protein [Planctomycetota bacterium]